jgi:hypothetical protein
MASHIRAESLSNHAIVMKELVEVRAELGTLRSDSLPSAIARMLVERDRGS